jgi:hypothetical protein
MARVNCKSCSHNFEATNYIKTSGAFVAGAATGAWVGSGIGIAGGPLGAIAGTIPGALIVVLSLPWASARLSCALRAPRSLRFEHSTFSSSIGCRSLLRKRCLTRACC